MRETYSLARLNVRQHGYGLNNQRDPRSRACIHFDALRSLISSADEAEQSAEDTSQHFSQMSLQDLGPLLSDSKKRPRDDDDGPGPTKSSKSKRAKSAGQSTQRLRSKSAHDSYLLMTHVHDIQCTAIDEENGDLPMHDEWLEEENNFFEFLQLHMPTGDGEKEILLGKVQLGERQTFLGWGPAKHLYFVQGRGKRLFEVPPMVQGDFKPEDFDFDARQWSNLAAPIIELEKASLIKVEMNLFIRCPQDSNIHAENGDLPYQFRLHITISLPQSALSHHEHDVSLVSASQRFLLTAAFAEYLHYPTDHENTIPFLFSAMKSAPPVSPKVFEQVQPSTLNPSLLPFQRRSVVWMLQREGKVLGPDGQLVSSAEEHGLPPYWIEVQLRRSSDGGMHSLWFHLLSGALTEERPADENPSGGLLAEEPGLGKTVESLALILLNSPRRLGSSWFDETAEIEVRPVKGTLIVTPPTLYQQWLEELEKHAPTLRVYHYNGWLKSVKHGASLPKKSAAKKGKKSASKGKGKAKATEADEDDEENGPIWSSILSDYDVVVTTYNTLQVDLVVARAPVKRPRREAALYSHKTRVRSPLIQVEWERVLMDEVQLVGGGRTAEMVSLIPRRSSWAVSGTPAKSTVADLSAPLRFLGIHSVLGSKMWPRALKPGFANAFLQMFDRYAIRTTKAEAEGLDIPKQTRFVVSIELGMIERHFYDQTLEEALQNVGLDKRGVAQYENWELDTAAMRSWLRKLRQACIHPQVGALQQHGPAGARHLGGAVRPIGDVLTMMIEHNWATLMTDKKSRINERIRVALLMQKGNDPTRHKKALEMLKDIRAESVAMIQELEEAIAKHDKEGKKLIAEANEKNVSTSSRSTTLVASDATDDVKGKGKAREGLEEAEETDSEEDEDSAGLKGLPANAVGDDHRARRVTLSLRLREVQVTLHRIEFSLGDLYHYLGKAIEEEQSYGNAESLRRMLLKASERVAVRAMSKLTKEVVDKGVKDKELRIAHAKRPGIKSEVLFDEANDIVDILEEQRILLWEWRAHIFELLTQKITSEGEEADGQEYQRALDTQVEVECYLKEYAALLADRKEVLNMERTALAAHDAQEKRLRHTKAAARAAAALHGNDVIPELLQVDEEEKSALANELTQKRKDCRATHPSNRALKSVMIDLNKIVSNKEEEIAIAKAESLRLRRIIAEQTALVDRLAGEQAPFRAAFNGRIGYFRQLQELSDTVAEIELEYETLVDALDSSNRRIRELEASIRARDSKQRFFGHMRDTCRQPVDKDSAYQIKFKSKDGPNNSELEPIEINARQIKYNVMSQEHMSELSKVESFGQYGAKIQTLVRHLLLIDERDPGSKSIVFSAFSDSLSIIEHALRANGVTCISIDYDRGASKNAAHEFRTNPGIQVFLLHGEKNNSGLNLTVAKRVMLVEPTVNSNFELQAIARVDRLGQKQQTEVFCYYAKDTVEQNILDNAARKGISLYTVENSSKAVNLGTASQEDGPIEAINKDKSVLRGDCIRTGEEMLAVIFPHLFMEVEDIEMEDVIPTQEDGQEPEEAGIGEGVAGPSRIRR
ncbi:hypothetical protein FRC02_002077 [Tulasnella sp. 418]|nr:hypothetical protein FRC02_002077 [Tulasnella sp. 418]